MLLSRTYPHTRRHIRLVLAALSLVSAFALIGSPVNASATTGGAAYAPAPKLQAGERATIAADGRTAIAPAGAPLEVQKAIWAANKITDKPYRYGGGHAKVEDSGYDCSGTISYALIGGGLLKSPLDSGSFMRWGKGGRGKWITVYTNPGHAYVVIAGLRLDTSGPGEKGPRWRKQSRSSRGFRARTLEGF